MKKLLFLISTVSVLFTSCKKDDDPSNKEKLTGKQFKLTSLTVSPGFTIGGTTITDIYAQYQACQKDDLTTFNTDGTYTDDEGASKCDPADPQTETGTWSFNSDETILTLDNTDSFTIITNDGSTLKGSYTEVDGGITYTYTATWAKQ